MKLRITLVANTSWYLYNFRKDIVYALQEQGHEVITLAPYDQYSEKLQKICKFQSLEHLIPKNVNPLREFRFYFEYKRIVSELAVDVILSFTIKPNLYGCLIGKKRGVPVIASITGLGESFSENSSFFHKIVGRFYRYSLKYASFFVFQNQDDFETLKSFDLLKAKNYKFTAGSGVDLNRFGQKPLNQSSNETVFVLASRLLREKGIIEYIESGKKLKEKGYSVRLILIGAVDESGANPISLSEVESWNEEGLIEYRGMVEDVRPHMVEAHAVVLPSYYREGIPKSLIEALALGRPIITTDWLGCRETVDDDENGFLIEAKSSDSLTSAMEKFINLPESKMTAMAAHSRRKAEQRFSVDNVIQEYLDIINNI